MSQITLSNNETQYQAAYPSVFKKINVDDVNVMPFQANKLWTFYSGSVTSSVLPLIGIYSNTLPALGSEFTYNDAKNIDGSLQTIAYHSINHLFYKYKTQPSNTFGPTDLNRTKKHLFQTASIFSIPQSKIGLGIKPASFELTCSFTQNTVYGVGIYGSSIYGGSTQSLYVKSDRYGNLYDANFATASIVSNDVFYEGFNEYFNTSQLPYNSAGVTYVPGVTTTTGNLQSIGLAANFSGAGYIGTDVPGTYNRDTNYAVSFFITSSGVGSATQLIASKTNSNTETQYPFKIELSGSKQIIFSVASNTEMVAQITSSLHVSSSWNHVVCQKSGSMISMYVNNTLHASASFNFIQPLTHALSGSGKINNTSSLHIGGYNTASCNFDGVIDELRIYNKSLSATEVGYLADRTEGGTLLQTQNIGNVYAQQGIIVCSTPDYRFHNIVNLPYTASYRSTVNMYELNVLTRVAAGDFNMSLNPTLTHDNNVTYLPMVSSSNFAPYVTTIGLYDDAGQLLAIGKLAQPIRKRSDVDMNFLIRLDLDKNIVKG